MIKFAREVKQPMYDVIVVGGGAAGIGAALSSARNGAKTLLIERYGFLGGMGTAGLVTHYDPIKIIEATGIAYELYARLKKAGGIKEFQSDKKDFTKEEVTIKFWEAGCGYDSEIYKNIAQQMLEESKVELMLHSNVTSVTVTHRRISSLNVYSKSGDIALHSKIIIDCTGDGDVAALAGAKFEMGSENGEIMSPTLCFEVSGVDTEKLYKYFDENPDQLGNHPRLGKYIKDHRNSSIIQGFYKIIQQAKEDGFLKIDLPEPGVGIVHLPKEGTFHVNATRVPGTNPLDNNSISHAEMLERKNTEHLFSFMKKYFPGFENSYITHTAAQIGIRESRRIIGEYLLTEDDIKNGTKFEDAVVRSKWAHCDTHSGKNMQWDFEFFEGPYYVPARCLMVKRLKNLLVAGRCISADRAAMASIRIQPIATMTGEAAGVMGAIASDLCVPIKDIPIKKVQYALVAHGVDLS